MLLSKQQIANAEDRKTKVVDMPEWGGEIKIRVMSVGEQLEFEKYVKENPDDLNVGFKLIINTCIDEKGNRLFDDSDIELLKGKSSESISKLFDAIKSLNNQHTDDIEQLAKNS